MIAIREKILSMRQNGYTWRSIAAAMDINPGVAWKIAVLDDYEPKDPKLRMKLGYPALIPTPACPRCGVVHVRKRCPTPKRYRSLFDIPRRELRRMFEERFEI